MLFLLQSLWLLQGNPASNSRWDPKEGSQGRFVKGRVRLSVGRWTIRMSREGLDLLCFRAAPAPHENTPRAVAPPWSARVGSTRNALDLGCLLRLSCLLRQQTNIDLQAFTTSHDEPRCWVLSGRREFSVEIDSRVEWGEAELRGQRGDRYLVLKYSVMRRQRRSELWK